MSPLIHPLGFIDSESMEDIARDVREQANFTKIPVDPFLIAKRLGIAVHPVTFEDDSVEGVLKFADAFPQILVRKASILSRQRFTVAHELGHWKVHWQESEDGSPELFEEFVDSGLQLYRRGRIEDPNSKADRTREIQANMFAAALLMPKKDLLTILPRFASIQDLAKTFGVSTTAMTYRINELDVW